MASRRPISGQVVLVTGAARGIGAGVARALAARGAKVALVGLEPGELAKVAAECGPDAAWFEADVTDREAIEGAVAAAVERFGGIDVAIVNAGIATGGTVRSIDPDAWERVVEVNLLGSWRTIRAVLPHVIARRGYVLQIASLAAVAHAPFMSAYNVSKAGVEALGNTLRTEVARHGVDVGVAYFSWIDTDMVRGADARGELGGMREKLSGPMGKTSTLEECVNGVVDGIERRRRWITVPGWVRVAILLRGPLSVLVDRGGRREVPAVEDAMLAAIEREGAAAVTAPVGAGGAADSAARAAARAG
ncbi:SDR family oxidoreductase, partial [Conexibacter sp. JD483]|uniref:SDR family oxidoreductase n=1 Tax=unclassified Conexibacter TaxID=2627773 RepID=UPI00271B2C29|nr:MULTISPECIES: SDR family oxidoreductase [unclassified Conexibacter]MDO8184102.1 SDR family oxidoreductase [Conexibacter sp. CPCC 205706]MDO8197094.1 SDR family oxidoreductase [Conexibacter sp. CPCC 205762]MDR9367591.1 SDR family oxidoreductase [Conexibacter sp. JD483]